MQCVRMGKRGEKWNTYGNVFMQRGWMALMLNKTHKGGPVYRSSDRGSNSKFRFPVLPVQINLNYCFEQSRVLAEENEREIDLFSSLLSTISEPPPPKPASQKATEKNFDPRS